MASLDWNRTQPTQQARSVGTVARSGGRRQPALQVGSHLDIAEDDEEVLVLSHAVAAQVGNFEHAILRHAELCAGGVF